MSLHHTQVTVSDNTLNNSGKHPRRSGALTFILWAAFSTWAQGLPGKGNPCLETVVWLLPSGSAMRTFVRAALGISTKEAPE